MSSTSIFKGIKDAYNGIVVKSHEETCDRVTMEQLLKNSLTEWNNQGIRGVWFEVQAEEAEWIPVLMQNGFTFHHAKGKLSVLLKWLSTEECPVPSYAHTLVGVGGMVVNDLKEILVVQEKYGKHKHWKLPGGYVDPGENLGNAVKREVLEETGLETEFVSIVAFRQTVPQPSIHNGVFGCSDFYFVCWLKPTNSTEIKMCTKELADAKWMKLEEYILNPSVSSVNQHFGRCLLAVLENSNSVGKITSQETISSLTNLKQTIYYMDYKI